MSAMATGRTNGRTTGKAGVKSGARKTTAGSNQSPSRPLKKAVPATQTSSKAKPANSVRRDLAPERVERILALLREQYGEAHCALNHRSPWELLVATDRKSVV